jgi:hypothetical protein
MGTANIERLADDGASVVIMWDGGFGTPQVGYGPVLPGIELTSQGLV